METRARNEDEVRELVREGYAELARREPDSGGGGGCCCSSSAASSRANRVDLIERIGYSPEELRDVPEEAMLGLSCGNPGAIAALQPGEVVLDLGAGAGFDCFVIGPRVGAQGRAIGVDMTPDMLTRSRRNLAKYRERTGLDNVEFRLGEIEHLPIPDASVDVVISNCVINLSPDKPQVWSEIARVLRPGGRVAISDIALLRPLPEGVRHMMEALVGCVAGAVEVGEVERMARAAGLEQIELRPKPEYVATLREMSDPLYRRIAAELPEGTTAADYLTSLDIRARKAPVA